MQKRTWIVIIISVICAFPLYGGISMAQAIDACSLGRQEALHDMQDSSWSILLWGASGCVLGPVGVLIGAVMPVGAPGQRLMGRTPEYAAAYSQCYIEEVKNNQLRLTTFGCLITSTGLLIYWGVTSIIALF